MKRVDHNNRFEVGIAGSGEIVYRVKRDERTYLISSPSFLLYLSLIPEGDWVTTVVKSLHSPFNEYVLFSWQTSNLCALSNPQAISRQSPTHNDKQSKLPNCLCAAAKARKIELNALKWTTWGAIMHMRADLKYVLVLIQWFQDRFRKMKRRILFILFLCNYWLSFSYCGFRKIPQNVSVILGEEITLQCAYESRGTSIVELWEPRFSKNPWNPPFQGQSMAKLCWEPARNSRLWPPAGSPRSLQLCEGLAWRARFGENVEVAYPQISRHFQKISDVRLDDDGEFECQMLNPDEGPIRAAAHLNVIGRAQTIEWRRWDNRINKVKHLHKANQLIPPPSFPFLQGDYLICQSRSRRH